MMLQKSYQIKKYIKDSLGKVVGAENSQIKRAIERAEIVSFDIFDTLVKRNVKSPVDIHELVRNEYFRQTGVNLYEYKKLRINAENEARKNGKKEEISLEEIYFYLKEISKAEKDKLWKIEEEMEIAACCANLRMKKIYEHALKIGKRVIITSDMYLDEAVIKKILYKCGYDNFEKIYLSSSYGLCKSSGSIYDIIKKDYATLQGKILHIGDHVKSDYVIPKRKGLEAVLIDGQIDLLRYWKRNNRNIKNQLSYGIWYSFLNNHIDSDDGDAVHIAYEVLGPMILGYCTWLHEKLASDNIEKIFFLSREGKILQEAFNILYPENKISQTYLYVSRQALVVPLLADARNFDEMIDVLKCFLHSPILNTICTVCGLDSEKFQEKLFEMGLSLETKIHKIPDNKKKEIYIAIKDLGGRFFKQQKEYVSRYLRENDFSGSIALADIGWSGTMQIALQKYIAGSKTTIRGYYMGVRNMESDEYYTSVFRAGYLFEPGKNTDYDLRVRFTTEIFEMLLLNRAGSVNRYAVGKDRIMPVLTESEYSSYEGDFLEFIQANALLFLNQVKKDELFKENIEIMKDIPMESYSHFAVYPEMHTINIYEKFQFQNAGRTRDLLPDHGFFYYIFHFSELKQELRECLCKIFFLKKVFKISFPYFKLLKFLVIKCNAKTEFRKRYYSDKKHIEKAGRE